MKWLRENWTKVVLVLLLIGLGFMWRNSIENRKDYNAKMEKYETDISLRKDTINNLTYKLEIEKTKIDSLEKENKELDKEIEVKEEEIKNKDKELTEEKKKIKQLPATEQIELLAENLSNETGDDIELTMKTSKGDTLVNLNTKQATAVNVVFAERNTGRIKLKEMDDLLVFKNDKIDNLDSQILSNNISINTLNETIEQQDGIITTKEDQIDELKKDNRRKKVKNFFVGLGTGVAVTAGVVLVMFAAGGS